MMNLHYESFQQKCDLVRDRTRAVALGYQCGVYLTGRAGVGKTHLVLETLDKLETEYVLKNGRMTPLGLFRTLQERPEGVIVIDDIPALAEERTAMQILLAALGGQGGGRPRKVTFSNSGKRFDFTYHGGLILISNVPLRRDPLADAVASRTTIHEHDVSDDELVAALQRMVLKGVDGVAPKTCMQVLDFVIHEGRRHELRLDFRTFYKALSDFRLWNDDHATNHWHDLVRASLRQYVQTQSIPKTKREQVEQECELVSRLRKRHPGDIQRQIAESALPRSTFYDRLNRLRSLKITG